MSRGSQVSDGGSDRWAYPPDLDRLAEMSCSDLQQPTHVPEYQRGTNYNVGDKHRPEFEKINQLTDAVENLGPLLKSFMEEQTLQEQNTRQLLDENAMLKAHISKEKSCESKSTQEVDILNENSELKDQLNKKDNLLKEGQAKLQELMLENPSIRAQFNEMQNIRNLDTTPTDILTENASLKTQLKEKVTLLQSSEYAYNKLYSENAEMQCHINTVEKELGRVKKNMDIYKNSLEKERKEKTLCIAEIRNLTIQRDECQKSKETLQMDKIKLEDEVAESKKRLSRLMGNKLSDNNPDIADLSDKNRPTKLAEKYSELYDNEWTDAFEVVGCNDKKKGVNTLLTLLQDVRNFCSSLADDHRAQITAAVFMTYENKQPSKYFSKLLKDFRRAGAGEATERVLELYIEKLQSNDPTAYQIVQHKHVQPFVRECLELCWLMSVQDPPLVIGNHKNQNQTEQFDTAIYKPYTKTGVYFDYLVWPPLYLHENGPLLTKGVAQAHGNKLPREIASKLNSGSRLSAGPGTAVPVGSTLHDGMDATPSQEMSRSCNMKTNDNNLSRTVTGASGFYDNNLLNMTKSEHPHSDTNRTLFGQAVEMNLLGKDFSGTQV